MDRKQTLIHLPGDQTWAFVFLGFADFLIELLIRWHFTELLLLGEALSQSRGKRRDNPDMIFPSEGFQFSGGDKT